MRFQIDVMPANENGDVRLYIDGQGPHGDSQHVFGSVEAAMAHVTDEVAAAYRKASEAGPVTSDGVRVRRCSTGSAIPHGHHRWTEGETSYQCPGTNAGAERFVPFVPVKDLPR